MVNAPPCRDARAGGRIVLLLALAGLLVLVFLWSVGVGAHAVSIPGVLRAIFRQSDTVDRRVIWNVRVPRCLTGAMVGCCLALSGATLQGLMKNPLASPGTIGVTSGAGLAATVCLVLAPKLAYAVTPAAFAGAMATTLLIYALSWQGGIQPTRMILAGMAVSAFVSAMVNAILLFYPNRVQNTLGFTIGTLSAKSWGDCALLFPYMAVGLLLCLLLAPRMNILALGDEVAARLGLRVEWTRLAFVCIASLLAAGAVSVVGLLGFVGLMVPHMARLLIGSDYRYLYPASALLGGTLTLLCDTAARTLFAPMELPAGIVLAVLGAPFFLYLLRGGLKRHAER